MTRDLINNLKGQQGLAPAVRTATALSSSFDTANYQAVIARFHIGTFGDTQSASVYLEAELQESADDVTYTAVADADLGPSSPATAITGTATGCFFSSQTGAGKAGNVAGLYECGYKGTKRYLKVNFRVTGSNATGSPCSVSFTAGAPLQAPIYGNLT